jgi:hypothetical protein
MSETQPTQPNHFIQVAQTIAEKTNDIITAANVLDGAAIIGAAYAVPKLDTPLGYIIGFSSYIADFADGPLARYTKTESWLGEYLDHIGDKPKMFYGLYHIAKNGWADKSSIAAVGSYSAITAGITIADYVINKERTIDVSENGRRAWFGISMGLGLDVLAHDVAKTQPNSAKVIGLVGKAAIGTGIVKYGIPTVKGYLEAAKSGARRRDGQASA